MKSLAKVMCQILKHHYKYQEHTFNYKVVKHLFDYVEVVHRVFHSLDELDLWFYIYGLVDEVGNLTIRDREQTNWRT